MNLFKFCIVSTVMGLSVFFAAWENSAHALDLEWSGQFRTEAHMVFNYSLSDSNNTNDTTRSTAGGYYVPGGGWGDSYFQTLFLKLRPTVVVNDNVFIKSEWWVGDPIYGVFGNAAPYTTDQRQFNSTSSRGSAINAQRVWGEFLTDIGTIQAGRAPLHWGLGVVWNSGDGAWDRYSSTGDVIRLVSKFGAFSFTPSVVKYSAGGNISGNCISGVCGGTAGGGGMSDYSLMFKYDNPDEDIELGVNYIKRVAGSAQDTSGYQGFWGTQTGMNYNVWDLYGKKEFGKFSIAGEIPITSGTIGSSAYKTYAIALETKWKMSDAWETSLKGGHAPGQPDVTITGPNYPDTFRAFFFNPNYKLGLIMFNYALHNFVGPNTQNNSTTASTSLKSPFDNPIVNANYLAFTGAFKTHKWKFHTTWVYAKAVETASPSKTKFYNYWSRSFQTFGGTGDQAKNLGWEMDYGATFHWDENFTFQSDFGWWFPGGYYHFSNTGKPNELGSVFAAVFRAGVTF